MLKFSAVLLCETTRLDHWNKRSVTNGGLLKFIELGPGTRVCAGTSFFASRRESQPRKRDATDRGSEAQ